MKLDAESFTTGKVSYDIDMVCNRMVVGWQLSSLSGLDLIFLVPSLFSSLLYCAHIISGFLP